MVSSIRTAVVGANVFDGDVSFELTLFRPSNSFRYVKEGGAHLYIKPFWGGENDFPVLRDYDRTGDADITVLWEPTDYWCVKDPAITR